MLLRVAFIKVCFSLKSAHTSDKIPSRCTCSNQGDLNKNEIQVNICSIICIFIFNDLYCKTRERRYFHDIPR